MVSELVVIKRKNNHAEVVCISDLRVKETRNGFVVCRSITNTGYNNKSVKTRVLSDCYPTKEDAATELDRIRNLEHEKGKSVSNIKDGTAVFYDVLIDEEEAVRRMFA